VLDTQLEATVGSADEKLVRKSKPGLELWKTGCHVTLAIANDEK
jgi:hypothetical protein